jgi:TPR repeat protein
LDHAIPPALANVPFALFVVSQLFDVVGEEELANEWADKLMALDAQNADAEVMFFKGYVYSEGIGRYEENQEYAMAFFKAAAALGHMDAMGNIAEMYYEGEKVERNDTLALSWAKMLYDSQHPFGLYIYGRAYYEGHGLAKNKKLGEQLLKKVAEMKHTNSLGVFSAQNFINENLSCD